MKTSLGAKTLAFPAPVFIVSTYDAQGRPNAMAVAWGGICCSKPPCLAISVRKATYTYGNLVERKAFTVSIPPSDQVAAADYFGLASGRDEDKFAVAGLTPVRSSLVDAPYVGEFPLVLECKVVQMAELGLHTQFVGEILDVKVEEDCLDGEGKILLEKIRPFSYAPGLQTYHPLGESFAQAFSVGRSLKEK